jgi:hypothetical protein
LSGLLTPILVPVGKNDKSDGDGEIERQNARTIYKPERSWKVLAFLFTFKGSFHLLLISAFETLFYFLYVNKSENEGIMKTIDTYYQPLVQNCSNTWSNETRWLVQELLAYQWNQTLIDASGSKAFETREAYNNKLLVWSSVYSVFCAVLCAGATTYVWWNQWIIPWKRMLAENFMFVFLLGIYEVFFFRTIIYNYQTLSTAELNQHIVDGLAECAV